MTVRSSMRWLIPVLCTLALSAASGHGSAAAGSGLVAAYGFNEGAGTTVADTSGSSNTGTVANTTWSTQGKFGGALSFNGTNARVNVPNSSSLQLSSTLTLEAWVNPSAITNAWRDVLYKGNDNYYLMATTQHGGGVPAGGGTFGGVNRNAFASTVLPLNSWSHLATTYDGTTLRTYVNGNLVGSQAASGTTSISTNALQIGGDSIFGQYFKGLIDEVRVYNTALSQTDIQADMATPVGGTPPPVDTTAPSVPGTLAAAAAGSGQINLSWGAATDNVAVTGYRVERCSGSGCTTFTQIATPAATSFQDSGLTAATSYSYRVRAADAAGNLGGYSNTATATTAAASGSGLVAAYSFDEGTGTTIADASGNANTGTTANTAWSTQGKYGGALTFNGVNARINIPNSSSLQLTTGMTLEAWVNPATISGSWRDVIYKGNDNYYLMATTDRTGGVPAAGGSFGATNSNANAYATNLLPLNTWSFLAATYDGAALRFYVNGTLAATQTQTGAITTSTNQLQIGSDSIWGQYFNGLIDQIRIYNTPLTAAALQTDMTTPIGPPGPNDTTPPSTPTGLTTSAIAQTTVTLNWNASTDNVAVTGYRLYQGTTQVATTGTTPTTYTYTGLTCGTTYTLGVAATDAATNTSTTATTSQQTAACTDTTPPSTPTGLTTSAIAQTTVTLNWNASTDNVAVTGYRLYQGTTQVATTGTTPTTYTYTGLTCGTTYTLGVAATDAATNTSTTATTSQQTAACTDTTPPSTPTGLTTSAIAQTTVTLNWNASTDNVAVTGYRLYQGTTQVATTGTTPTTYTYTGLTCGTTYTLGVAATDAATNTSTTATTSQQTAACTDTTAPSVPGTLAAAAAGSGQINLSWGAATDNVAVTGYRVERCSGSGCTTFTQIATPAATSFQDSGLTAATSYSYRVRAADAAGNLGGYSNTATATTAAASGSGLVAAYSFDEGTGTTIADASGNANTGTTANTAWSTQGKYGGALTFNGVNARINIPNSSSLQLTTGMTLEAWVNPATISGSWRDVIYKGNDNYYLMATTDRTGGVPAAGGSFGATNSNANAYATNLLPLNTWSFLAATYDGAALRFYVNGTLAATQTQTGAITTSTNQLQIGSDSIWGQYFNGLIDQIRIYNTPLTAAALQTDMTTPIGPPGPNDTTPPSAPGTLTATAAGAGEIDLSWGAATDDNAVAAYRIDRCQGASCADFSHLVQTGGPGTTFADTTNLAPGTTYRYQVRAVDGAGNLGPYSNPASATTVSGSASLVAAYSFDEGAGTSVSDASGFGNAGTIAGATWSTQGKFGNALAFNGTSAVVNVPSASSLQLSSGMTLEAWVNPAATSTAWRDVVYKANDNYYLMATTDRSGGAPGAGGNFGTANTNANAFATSVLPLNTWTHLAATYDGATLRLYVNGALVASQAVTGLISSSANPLQIGGDSLFGQYFNGRIDEVRVYNAPLSAAAIQSDMNAPIAGGLPTRPPNLVATVKSSTEVALTWGTSTDLAGVIGYRVERCQGDSCTNFTEIAAPAPTAYNDTGLTPSTRYTYRVRAIDSAGLFGPYSESATAWTGLQISPRQVAVTPGQTQQFAAALPAGGSTSVNWSVDGIAGGTMLTGLIDPSGLYTAGTAVGPHVITGTTTDQSQSGTATAYTTNYPGTFTHHNDNLRTGENAAETVLTPANVNASNFGKLFSQPLDGTAYASPLYVANVAVPNQGTHNVVYVATEHDSVYAFDADGRVSNPLWKVSFINPVNGITTVPAMDTGECCDIENEIGITGTPVIDPASNTLYIVVATKEVSGGTTKYPLRLHALDLRTGAEKFGGPVLIQATVPGTGLGSSGGQLPFDPLRENQHAALLLLNGVVYFSFSSHGDFQAYHGWVFGYDATTLQQKLVFCLTPNSEGAGVWMGGGGLASDSTGAIYYISGDGAFNGTNAWGDSYIKMTTAGVVADSFTPFNQAQIDASNADLGSGGGLLLPDQPGAHPHLMVSSGKDGTIYLVDRDNMGRYNTSTNNIVQTLPSAFPPNGSSGSEPGNFSSPVYFGGYVFFSPNGSNVQGFKLTNGLLPTSASIRSASIFPDRGAAMAVSANGTSNGILWVTQRNGTSAPGTLFAFDPAGSTNGALKELYDSAQAAPRDTLDVEAKFTVPLVANGKVFVAGQTRLTAFGLLP